jgi:ABC-2 type transport system permease protein
MATTALPLSYTVGAYSAETKYEILKQSRNRMYAFSAIGFPVMFYLLFGVANRHVDIAGISVAKYLLASYCIFGIMGAALFGVGVNFAIERGQGWLELKQASPMPPLAIVIAKSLSSCAFALVIVALLVLCGVLFAGVHITTLQVLKLAAVVVAGALPFGAFGLIFGMLAPANAAPGLVNIIYLPMAYASGLWFPIMYLPHWVQKIAPMLPSYHLAQLGYRALGFSGDAMSNSAHWNAIAGFTLLFLGIDWILFRYASMKA